jgi:hypothetical protein
MGVVGDLIRKAETHSRYLQRLDRVLDDEQIRPTLLHRIGARAIHDDAGPPMRCRQICQSSTTSKI